MEGCLIPKIKTTFGCYKVKDLSDVYIELIDKLENAIENNDKVEIDHSNTDVLSFLKDILNLRDNVDFKTHYPNVHEAMLNETETLVKYALFPGRTEWLTHGDSNKHNSNRKVFSNSAGGKRRIKRNKTRSKRKNNRK